MRHAIVPLLILACGAATAGAQPDSIIIPHDVHFENDVACTDCHEGLESSRSALDTFRPPMETCENCHDVEDDGLCTMCHTNPDEAGDYPAPAAYGAELFPHAAHLSRDMACAACHGDPASYPVIPGKPDCRVCHQTADDYADCRMCHGESMDLRPASHGPHWAMRHGGQARQDEARCFTCHTQTTCQECHAGDNIRPRSHTLDFAFAHAAAARGNETECATCHQDPVFCSSCHREMQVMPRNHSQAGWVRLPDGGSHALEGVFEIESCIACHDEGPTAPKCAECHGG